jgi:hypothetical protein
MPQILLLNHVVVFQIKHRSLTFVLWVRHKLGGAASSKKVAAGLLDLRLLLVI